MSRFFIRYITFANFFLRLYFDTLHIFACLKGRMFHSANLQILYKVGFISFPEVIDTK